MPHGWPGGEVGVTIRSQSDSMWKPRGYEHHPTSYADKISQNILLLPRECPHLFLIYILEIPHCQQSIVVVILHLWVHWQANYQCQV